MLIFHYSSLEEGTCDVEPESNWLEDPEVQFILEESAHTNNR